MCQLCCNAKLLPFGLCKKTVEVPQVQFLEQVVDVSAMKQRQVSTFQKCAKRVGSAQVQFSDRSLTLQLRCRGRSIRSKKRRGQLMFHRCSLLTWCSKCGLPCNDRFTPSVAFPRLNRPFRTVFTVSYIAAVVRAFLTYLATDAPKLHALRGPSGAPQVSMRRCRGSAAWFTSYIRCCPFFPVQ